MTLDVRRNTDITPWDPFRQLADFDAHLNRLFDSAFAPMRADQRRLWSPPVDVEETDSSYVIEADLPGVKEKDVTIELDQNVLSIHGEVKERERVGILRRQTRRTGEFDYRMTVPADIDAEKVTATLSEGVLRVEIAKSEAAQPKRIEITQD